MKIQATAVRTVIKAMSVGSGAVRVASRAAITARTRDRCGGAEVFSAVVTMWSPHARRSHSIDPPRDPRRESGYEPAEGPDGRARAGTVPPAAPRAPPDGAAADPPAR